MTNVRIRAIPRFLVLPGTDYPLITSCHDLASHQNNARGTKKLTQIKKPPPERGGGFLLRSSCELQSVCWFLIIKRATTASERTATMISCVELMLLLDSKSGGFHSHLRPAGRVPAWG